MLYNFLIELSLVVMVCYFISIQPLLKPQVGSLSYHSLVSKCYNTFYIFLFLCVISQLVVPPIFQDTAFLENNYYILYLKNIGIIGTIILVYIFTPYLINNNMYNLEVLFLVCLSLLGLLLFISSKDLLISFLALEIQSLSFYVLASSNKTSPVSVEAGLKYFILGSISSGIFLIGLAVVYGTLGTTALYDILLLEVTTSEETALLIGTLFIIVAFLFKIGTAPFHVWLPDVYEGSPLFVTAYFTIVPKLFIYCFFFKFFIIGLQSISDFWSYLISFSILLTFLIGSFGAFFQKRIKRLLAYSTIGHNGFMLIPLISNDTNSLIYLVIYMISYIISNIIIFGILSTLRDNNGYSITFLSEFRGLANSHFVLAICLGITLLSVAGIPPLMGFFAKYYVILSAINSGHFVISVVAILTSTLSCYYYLKLSELSFFWTNKEKGFLWNNLSVNESTFKRQESSVSIFFFLFIVLLTSQIYIDSIFDTFSLSSNFIMRIWY